MTQLIFTTPEFEGQSFQVPEGKTTVGRAADNTLRIEHETISAYHCEILRYGREVIVRDRASTNGIWVGNARIRGQTCVAHGQPIRFGAVEARLEIPPPTFQDYQTEVTAIRLLVRTPRQSDLAPEPASPVVIKPASCASACGCHLRAKNA